MRERKRPILDEWLARTGMLASARRLELPALLDHVPDLLDRVGTLSDDIATRGSGPFPMDLAARHGVQRLSEGFDLAEVMLEYSLLRDCLLRDWESHGHPRSARSSALSSAVDVAASASVESYTSARDRTLQAVDRVSAAALESTGLDELLDRILKAFVQTEPAVTTAVVLLRDGPLLRGRAAEGLDVARVRYLTVKVADVCGDDVPRRSARLRIPAADDLVREAEPGIRALHGVPLVDGQALVGVVHLGSRTAFEFADQDINLFQALANRATTAIFQQLLRQDAERRTAELDTVIESIPAAIYIGDEGGITRSNRLGLEILGYRSVSDMSGRIERRADRLAARDAATGERVAPDELPFARALQGEQCSREMIFRHAGTGEDIFVHTVAAPIVEDSRIVGAVAVNHDVTAYVRALDRVRLGERRLKLALDVTKLGIWERDLARDELDLSARCRDIHGIGAGESVTYDRFLERVHPDDREVVRSAIAGSAAAAAGTDQDVEYRVLLPGGEVRWVAMRWRSFFDEAKTPSAIRMIGTALDVTERRRTQEEQTFLAEAGKILASSLDHRETLGRVAKLAVPRLADWCGVEILLDGRPETVAVESVEPAKAELARRLRDRRGPHHDASGAVARVLRSGVAELHEEVTDEVLRQGARDPEHLGILEELGLRSAMLVPMVAGGRTVGILSFASAETGRRYTRRDLELAGELATRAALALENARLFQESQEAVRVREQILAVVSHDLRNPLGTISVSASLLLQLPACRDPSALRHVQVIQRSTLSMEHLLRDLLDMASIQAGRLAVVKAPIDAGALVREAVESVEMKAAHKGLSLRSEIDLAGITAPCDRDRIIQAIGNLLGNSIKFSRRGESITVRAHVDGPWVRIVIADTGPGIRAEDLPHVFESYWSAAVHARSGTGLGLSITKGIVEAHGGRISMTSEVGVGTTVVMLLPRV